MTYFAFLFRFLVLPIILFLAIARRDQKQNRQAPGFRNGRVVWIGIAIHVILAVVYTTPWDNYLVATGVWYYNPELVAGVLLGYVPIEEYTFFVLETVLAGLWWWFLARRLPPPDRPFQASRRPIYLSVSLLLAVWIVSSYLFFFGAAGWTYLAIILFWALPPVILQMLFGADILWHFRRLVFWSIAVPGTYLSLMDIFALRETTWSISPGQTTGILFFGILPIEEVVFFFITNVLITLGLTLLLAEVSQSRVARLRRLLSVRGEKPDVNLQAR